LLAKEITMNDSFVCRPAAPESAIEIRHPQASTAAGGRCTVLSVLFAFPFLVASAQAATYHVSQSGSDSNSCEMASTTAAGHKLTISAGLACLSAGDTLYIHAGNYTGTANIIDSETWSGTFPSGTNFDSGAITIAAFPGETVVIQPPNGRQAIRLTTGAPHYLIFKDLVLDGINQTVLPQNGGPDLVYLSGAHHNRFLRLEAKRNVASGYGLSPGAGPADYNEIIGGSIHDNGRLAYGNTGYGVYIKTSNNLISGVDIYGNNGYGIHMNTTVGNGNNNQFVGNRIHGNLVHGDPTAGGSTSYGIVIIGGSGNLIANNLIYGNQGGILVYNSASNTDIYNNTIAANAGHGGGGEGGIDLQYQGAGNVIRNNILYQNVSAITDYGDISGRKGNYTADHNLTNNPNFVDPWSSDFRLLPGSPATDAGVSTGLVTTDYAGVQRPQAGAYDIGAYEYSSTLTGPRPPDYVFITKR